MMFKKCFKSIRSTTMFNNFSVDDFINIPPVISKTSFVGVIPIYSPLCVPRIINSEIT